MIPATGGRLGNQPLRPRSRWCDCKMILYERQKEGHFASRYIIINGERKRLTYALHCWHLQWHRKHDKEGTD